MRETAVKWITSALNWFSRSRERQPVAFGPIVQHGPSPCHPEGLQVVQGYLIG